ncbi:MAG: Tad domain-containing protein [Halobacteriovoraceae bacterium]|nr:Tad domain-containing protein [Halobacteriovoraceae bacterium]
MNLLKKIKLKRKNEKGQITIFLAFSLIIVASFLAFVINIGLFVKAKINLQNAVDAGAWSGAAVQARQLSQISYLNWELRNTFKEWMFKYYVVGQLGLLNETDVTNVADLNNNGVMNFRTQSMYTSKDGQQNSGNAAAQKNYNQFEFDPYNVPSVCLHFSGNYNICKIFSLPGVPKFGSTGLVGIDGQTQNFANVISKDKSRDCAKRTDLNFMVAMIWAFGVYNGSNSGLPSVPNVAADRMGAWPQAFELGIRMRNLEWIMNQPPKQNICYNGNTTFGGCTPVSNFDPQETSLQTPFHERTIKAFYTVGRNLDNEMKSNLIVSEIPPNVVDMSSGDNLSTFLIPNSETGSMARKKYYLNLKAMPVNYTMFYTNFVPYSGKYYAVNSDREITMDAQCAGSKMAIPIPSYILGMTKGQEVVTYYALKAKTKYVGLFFPFGRSPQGAIIQAYAAAKPFGGRIGPKLFFEEESSLKARTNPSRSANFASVFDISRPLFDATTARKTASGWDVQKIAVGEFAPGHPVPLSQDFWAEGKETVIGGIDPIGNNSKFVVPNLIYEGNSEGQTNSALTKLQPAENEASAMTRAGVDPIGLYDVDQFKAFASHARGHLQGNILNGDGIKEAIRSVRSPTNWEKLNYLIPTKHPVSEGIGVQHASLVSMNASSYQLYAPLYGEGLIYENETQLQGAVEKYIDTASNSIDSFLKAFASVAQSMRNQSSDREQKCLEDKTVNPDSCRGTYLQAANDLHNGIPDCSSIAGKFAYFLTGEGKYKVGQSDDCGIKPLSIMLREYYSQLSTGNASISAVENCNGKSPQLYYCQSYEFTTDSNGSSSSGILASKIGAEDLMTGYMPGPRSGISQDGIHPKLSQSMRRNFYSTKFIPMHTVISGSPASIDGVSVYQELFNLGQGYENQIPFRNKIPMEELSEFGKQPSDLKF